MSLKVCSCTHRKELHLIDNQKRVGCTACECQQYRLAKEFVWPGYEKAITGSYRHDMIRQHLIKCGIGERMPCLYIVEVPHEKKVRIGKTMDLLYRWMTRIAEWPALYDVRLICAVRGAQDLESEVHERFKYLRVYSEWFIYDKEFERLKDADLSLLQEIISEKRSETIAQA